MLVGVGYLTWSDVDLNQGSGTLGRSKPTVPVASYSAPEHVRATNAVEGAVGSRERKILAHDSANVVCGSGTKSR